MNLLILPDRLNWAYHSIALALSKYTPDDVSITIQPIKKNKRKIKQIYKKYDLFLVMGWQTFDDVSFLPKDRTLIGIHSHHSFDKGKTTPDQNVDPPVKLVDWMNDFLRVNAVSRRLYNLFSCNRVENLYYTPNGVDLDLFTSKIPSTPRQFNVGYTGTYSHDWRKGITEIIKPAVKKSGANLQLAMQGTNSYVTLKDMPKFYKQLDCYVCASLSEGFSLSVLEAAATGLPIISTRVGGCEDLIKHAYNGYLVDRSVDDVADKISELKKNRILYEQMSRNMFFTVQDHFGWEKRSVDWFNFIKGYGDGQRLHDQVE